MPGPDESEAQELVRDAVQELCPSTSRDDIIEAVEVISVEKNGQDYLVNCRAQSLKPGMNRVHEITVSGVPMRLQAEEQVGMGEYRFRVNID